MCIHNENIDIHNWSMVIYNWNKDIHNWNINCHNWIMDTHNSIIKSPGIPGVTLCFCAGSYAPLPRRRPQTFVHAITSEQLFGFLSFLVGLMTLTCRLDYLIRFWSIFVLTLTLNWIFKVKYGMCYNAATNGLMATKQKANILFVLWALNVTMRFDLGHGLDLKFSQSNMKFAIPQVLNQI